MLSTKENERALMELFKKIRLDEQHEISDNIKDMLIAMLSYFSKLKPNLGKHNPLTFKESLCLILLAIGKNPDQCADLLGIKMVTVQNTEKRIRHKLGARNRTHALYIASVRGYLTVIN